MSPHVGANTGYRTEVDASISSLKLECAALSKPLRQVVHLGGVGLDDLGEILQGILRAAPATAHVPSKCGQLFIDAGKESAWLTRKGKAVSDLSMNGLDVVRRASRQRVVDEYLRLADQVAQLLGGQKAFFEALTKAINCTAGRSQ